MAISSEGHLHHNNGGRPEKLTHSSYPALYSTKHFKLSSQQWLRFLKSFPSFLGWSHNAALKQQKGSSLTHCVATCIAWQIFFMLQSSREFPCLLLMKNKQTIKGSGAARDTSVSQVGHTFTRTWGKCSVVVPKTSRRSEQGIIKTT